MKIEAVVDRFEEEKAVLLLNDETQTAVIPRTCLPSETQEGDYLTITIKIDEEKTRWAQEEAERLFQDLTN